MAFSFQLPASLLLLEFAELTRPARGCGRQRKAWGEAQRNPRLTAEVNASPRSGRKSLRLIAGCRPLPRARVLWSAVPGVERSETPGDGPNDRLSPRSGRQS